MHLDKTQLDRFFVQVSEIQLVMETPMMSLMQRASLTVQRRPKCSRSSVQHPQPVRLMIVFALSTQEIAPFWHGGRVQRHVLVDAGAE